jgi:hypothetical protein
MVAEDDKEKVINSEFESQKIFEILKKTAFSLSNYIADFFGLNDNPRDTDAREKTSARLEDAQQNIDTANEFMAGLVPGANFAKFGYDLYNGNTDVAWAALPFLALDAVTMGKGKVAKAGIQVLKPLGLGSTGRTAAANLTEQLAMKEIMSNPTLGKVVITGMKDSRWLGWNKMQYTHTALDKTKTTIHYVGQFKNDVLTAVDDFKFVFP